MIQLLILLGTAGVVAGTITTPTVSFSQATLVAGCPVEVTCSVVQDVAKTITYKWFKDDEELAGKTGRSFKIDVLADSDDGDYKCKATETGGTEVPSDALTMTVAAVTAQPAPAITDDKEVNAEATINYGIGDEYTLTCGSAAKCSAMTYKWTAASAALTETSRTIKIKASDSAVVYKCKTVLGVSESSDSADHSIQGKKIKKIEVVGTVYPVHLSTDKAKYVCNVEKAKDAATETVSYTWQEDASTGTADQDFQLTTDADSGDKTIKCEATDVNGDKEDDQVVATQTSTPEAPDPTVKEGVDRLTKNVKYTLKCDNDASKSYTGLTYEWKKGGDNGEDTAITECTEQECEITAVTEKFNCQVTVPTDKVSGFQIAGLSVTIKQEKGKYCEAIADCNTDPTVYSGDCIANICACKNNGEKLNNGCLAGNPGTRATYSLVVLLLAAFTGYLMKM